VSNGVGLTQTSTEGSPEPAPLPQTAENLLGVAIAVLIPCYNEEIAIQAVVHDFRAALPAAQI
jgi:hypothetical protein